MYPLKFKAAILSKSNSDLIIDNVIFPGPLGVGQVLVKLEYSGICGKQIEEITAKMGPDPFLPHLLGHEGYGKVIDCGPGVKTVSSGNNVVMHWMKGVGIDSETPDYSWNRKVLNAGWITTFNEFAVVSENRLTVMPKETDGKVACLLGCAVTTGIGAVVNEADTKPHHNIAIVGCGGIGLNCIMGGVVVNAKKIVSFDKKLNARKLALKIGAHESYALSKGHKNLFDKVFVTSANSKTIEFGFEICRDKGDIFIVGVPAPNEVVQLDALSLHGDKSIHGSLGGGIYPEIHIPAYYTLHKRKAIDVNNIIEQTYSLDEINTAVEKMINGKSIGRQIIKLD